MASRNAGGEGFWRGQIAGQVRSGEPVRGYCRRRGLKESSFYYWRRRLGGGTGKEAGAAFVPVEVVNETARPDHAEDTAAEEARTGVIEILLANERRVRVTGPVDRQTLADVLAVVAGALC